MGNVVSENCGGGSGGALNAEHNDQGDVMARLDASTVLSATFPMAPNEGCCSAGIGRDEVTGSNSSREVGGLGQVLSLVTTGDHGGVSAGCGCSPDGDAALVQVQRQAPLGVNPSDGTPLNLVSRDNVANVHATLADDESRSPECCPDGRCEECGNDDSAQPVDNAACCGGGCCGDSKNQNEDDSEGSAGTGYERRHVLHVVTEETR